MDDQQSSRYFLELAYRGTPFKGWQRQPDTVTVQGTIEQAFHTYFREHIDIVGCGRTDTGVHASQYYAHFDATQKIDNKTLYGLNALTGHDIVLKSCQRVDNQDHARFSATQRTYHYYLRLKKSPFYRDTQSYIPRLEIRDLSILNNIANIYSSYNAFAPFCKTGSDQEHYNCDITSCYWEWHNHEVLKFTVSANRFLRGMIRLMVGASIKVLQKHITIEDIRHALDTQSQIPGAYSAPPEGLFLAEITYPKALNDRLHRRV